jgi:hypothetical protein
LDQSAFPKVVTLTVTNFTEQLFFLQKLHVLKVMVACTPVSSSVMDSDIVMTEAVAAEHTVSLFSPLTMDLKVAVEALIIVLERLSDAPDDMAILRAFVDDPENTNKSHLLDCVSRLMLRQDLTMFIIRTFRPLAVDLVARWLTPRFLDFLVSNDSIHIVYRIESTAKAFSLILPIAPQTKRYDFVVFMA